MPVDSTASALTLWQSLTQAIPHFIRYLPIIWIVSFAWSKLLAELLRRGFIEDFPPQELIKLFTNGGDLTAIALLAVIAVVLAPLVEEIIFRGGIYRFFKSQSTVLPAQIISGALFALMHGNLMSFLPLVVVGIILARVYESSGNILMPICFHAYFNGFSLLMLLIMSKSPFPLIESSDMVHRTCRYNPVALAIIYNSCLNADKIKLPSGYHGCAFVADIIDKRSG